MAGAIAQVTPGVYFQSVDFARLGIGGVRTDIAGFVGIAERGPVGQATRVESWEQFVSTFGTYVPNGFLAYAAHGFFANGGATCVVVRSAGPDASVASAPLLGEDGLPTLEISATSQGAWGNGLAIKVGRSNPAATMTSTGPQPVDRSGCFVNSTAGFNRYSVVRLSQPGATGLVERYRIVASLNPALALLTWDRPLDDSIDLNQPMFLEVQEFYLTIYERGKLKQLLSRLSIIADHERYLVRVLQEQPSDFIVVSDPSPLRLGDNPLAGLSLPNRLPSAAAVNLVAGVLTLTGGADGIASLQPVDLTGDPAADAKTGLRALEDVEDVAIVAIPDALIRPVQLPLIRPLPTPPPPDPCLPHDPVIPAPPPPPPLSFEQAPDFSLDQVFRIQQALVAHAEGQANRIAVLDAPIPYWRAGGQEVAEVQAWRLRFDSKYAALYFPWLRVTDPLMLAGQVVRAVPPSGHVAGLYAQTDLDIGPHQAPANRDLNWVQALTTDIDGEVQGALNPVGVNCIRAFPGRGIRVFGARTVSSDQDWRFINVRRLMMMIERAVLDSIQWSVFEPNDVYVRQLLTVAISSFLETLWRRGALVGATAAEAYYVRCDQTNNPTRVSDAGQLIAEVGVAAVRPAEFIIFRIGRTDDNVEATE